MGSHGEGEVGREIQALPSELESQAKLGCTLQPQHSPCGDSQAWGQPRLHGKMLSQEQRNMELGGLQRQSSECRKMRESKSGPGCIVSTLRSFCCSQGTAVKRDSWWLSPQKWARSTGEQDNVPYGGGGGNGRSGRNAHQRM